MTPEDAKKTVPLPYFITLCVLQAIILIFGIIGGFMPGIFFTFMRVILLLIAYFCKNSSWIGLYAVFALIAGLFSFDPVGLFVTGHGQIRSLLKNILCLLACCFCFLASYIGYLFKISMDYAQENQSGGNHQAPYIPVNQPFRNNQQSANNSVYNNNSSSYQYQAASNPPPPQRRRQGAQSRFVAFAGQGTSLS